MRIGLNKTRWAGGLCLAGLLVAVSAHSTLIVFDENGYSNIGLQWKVTRDTNPDGNGPAGGGATLAYLYPVGLNNDHVQLGWVVIKDPNGVISDLIRFDSTTQVGSAYYQQIFFYSNDHDGDPADNWPAATVISQILTRPNTVTIAEDANGIAWFTPASSSQPGYHLIGSSPGAAYSYEFISGVPEPTTILAGVLMLLPFGAGTIRALRKNRAA